MRATNLAPRQPKPKKFKPKRHLTDYQVDKAKLANRQPGEKTLEIRRRVEEVAQQLGFPGFDVYGYRARNNWTISVYEAHVVLCREAGLSYPETALAWNNSRAAHITAWERMKRVTDGHPAKYTMEIVKRVKEMNHD